MKERYYIALWDDGHDWGEFEFKSCHRANSQANIADATKEACLTWGNKRGRAKKVYSTHLLRG